MFSLLSLNEDIKITERTVENQQPWYVNFKLITLENESMETH